MRFSWCDGTNGDASAGFGNKQDCYPTEIKYVGTSLFARRREDGAWIIVPLQKIERNRDNPDGRNHVGMPPPNHSQAGSVFCFSLGGGI